jgi:hypothetical protein
MRCTSTSRFANREIVFFSKSTCKKQQCVQKLYTMCDTISIVKYILKTLQYCFDKQPTRSLLYIHRHKNHWYWYMASLASCSAFGRSFIFFFFWIVFQIVKIIKSESESAQAHPSIVQQTVFRAHKDEKCLENVEWDKHFFSSGACCSRKIRVYICLWYICSDKCLEHVIFK